MLVAVSPPNSANWVTTAKPSAIGNAASCRTVLLTALAAKLHARRFLHTVRRSPRVATTTAVVTTVDTPTLTSLTMVPHDNFNTGTQEAPKVVAQCPTRIPFFSPTMACLQHLPPGPTHQVCITGRLRSRNPTGTNRGHSAPTDYPTSVYWNFPSRRQHSQEVRQTQAPAMAPPAQTLPLHRENRVRGSLPDIAKTVRKLRP